MQLTDSVGDGKEGEIVDGSHRLIIIPKHVAGLGMSAEPDMPTLARPRSCLKPFGPNTSLKVQASMIH